MIFLKCRWGFSLILTLLAMASLVVAQDYRGKVQGVVTDVNGAAIPGATVVLHNDETGVEVTRETNGEGRYIFDFVEPGIYSILVEQAGFKKSAQKSVIVRNRGDITGDFKMETGGIEETVTVEEGLIEVQFNSSSSSLTFENKIIDQLPVRGRNPYNVTTLDPTVTGGEAGENRPYHHAFANNVDAGGGTTNANDVQLDGVPLTSSFKTSYTPSLDAVKEITFAKNAIDSEQGYSAGGIISVNMKSGTNEWHGSAYHHRRDPRFNAFADPTLPRINGADESPGRGTKLRIYGFSLGGPIMKNKVFTFTSYETWNDSRPLSVKITFPTALERMGDFSQSLRPCAGGTQCSRRIYDPLTGTGTSGVRTQFAGNVIPTIRFDPTAVKLLDEIPLPNLPGSFENWQGFKSENVDYWNFSQRVDLNFSDKLKTFVRYGHFKANLLEANPTDKKLFPLVGSNRYGLSIAADTVYTISPKMVLNVRGNFHQLTDEAAAPTVLLGEEGLEQLWPGNPWYASLYTLDQTYYPALDVRAPGASTTRLGRQGREFWQHPQGFGGSARLNVYAGNHTVKFGGELRVDRGKGLRAEPINLDFRPNLTADRNGGPDLTNTGSEWASFLLGYMDQNSSARRVPLQEVVSLGYSTYFMDDWKFNNKLTLNLGLRWEFEPGPVDRGDRLSLRLDLTDPIPQFQSAPPPIPVAATNLLASHGLQHSLTGAWIFADENNRNAWHREKLNLLPRLGAAYRLDGKSVLRFGWGRYMEPSSKVRDPLGDFVNQYTGFATTTPGLAPTTGATPGRPQTRLSDPFPSGVFGIFPANPVQLPRGQSLGRYTNLGNNIGASGNGTDGMDEFNQKPRVNDRFSLSYQRAVWGRTVFSMDYFFNRGHNIPYSVDINMVDPSFFYENPRSLTNQTFANPFRNLLTPDTFPGQLRSVANLPLGCTGNAFCLLRPFPLYGSINQTHTSGKKSHLHSFTFQAQRPFTKGLSMLLAYAYQREAQTEFFDDLATYAREFSWRYTNMPRHRLTNAVSWDIPVGHGRRLLSDAPRAVDLLLGGWQFTTTSRLYSGRLLQFTQSLVVSGNPRLEGATRDKWFDTSVFSRLPDSDRNVARTNDYNYPGVVGPSTMQTDATMSKSFRLTERLRLEARVESYNIFNRINWDNPVVDFNSINFGKITSKRGEYIGREIQYGLRLVF
jgi:Carboxypeptidase regulatory-like domain